MIQEFERTQALERELHLRQLQVRRLLQMTQAINNNVSADDLFDMYRAFLRGELGVHRMALFVRDATNDNAWQVGAMIGLEGLELPRDDMGEILSQFTRSGLLFDNPHPFLDNFVHIVPVLHKERPIAYILVGTFEGEEDMFERIQIITTITNVIAVAIENKRLFRRQLEQERLEADLDLGAKVQTDAHPRQLPGA